MGPKNPEIYSALLTASILNFNIICDICTILARRNQILELTSGKCFLDFQKCFKLSTFVRMQKMRVDYKKYVCEIKKMSQINKYVIV